MTASVALEGPEVLEFELDAPGEIEVRLEEGSYGLTMEAPGFDAVTTTVAIWGDTVQNVDLYSDQPVALSGYVARGAERVQGARVTLIGDRIAVPAVADSETDGTYLIDALPAGTYDVRVAFGSEWAVERSGVELLSDTELNFVLPVPNEERDVTTTRSLCASAPTSHGLAWGLALALVALRRRR